MSKKPRVTVIIPAYNCEHSIEQCIGSVLSQTVSTKEIIVVDDGSTDGTGDILKRSDGDIRLIEQENKGQGAARNAGLRVAQGEFVAFLDADDYWEPEFLEKCSHFLTHHPDAVAVLTAWTKIENDHRRTIVPPAMNRMEDKPDAPFIIPNFLRFWVEQGHIQTGAIMIRHDVIRKAGHQREDLRVSQDLEHWLLIATFGQWGFIPEPLFVSNSRINARRNWINRYRQRRNLCPTVESWQARLVKRIPEADWPHFNRIRGRVAANFSHSKILSGRSREAKTILNTYGVSMPVNRLTRLMRFGAKAGEPVWRGVCHFIRMKELMKNWKLQRSAPPG